MDEMRAKLMQHDFAITQMTKSITELAETTKDNNTKLGNIVISMSKQELILEKLANLEDRSDDGIRRVHQRIDELASEIGKCKSMGEKDGCTALQLLREQSHLTDKTLTKRLDVADKHKTWIVLAILGTVITAVVKSVMN